MKAALEALLALPDRGKTAADERPAQFWPRLLQLASSPICCADLAKKKNRPAA
jgi:hypothetical protein